MFPPFAPDPGWYDRYWYSERPEQSRVSFSASLARFAVLAALVIGSGLVLSSHHVHKDASSGLQSWEQE